MIDTYLVEEENADGMVVRSWMINSTDNAKHTFIYRDIENGATIVLSIPNKLIEELRKMRGY